MRIFIAVALACACAAAGCSTQRLFTDAVADCAALGIWPGEKQWEDCVQQHFADQAAREKSGEGGMPGEAAAEAENPISQAAEPGFAADDEGQAGEGGAAKMGQGGKSPQADRACAYDIDGSRVTLTVGPEMKCPALE